MKLILYIVVTIVFGLMQIWSTALILYLNESDFGFADLIKDGGLFFFSSSLAVSSIVNLSRLFKVIDVETILFFLIGGIIIIVFSCLAFSSGFPTSKDDPASFTLNHHKLGVALTILSIIYGLFTEIKLRKFIDLKPL